MEDFVPQPDQSAEAEMDTLDAVDACFVSNETKSTCRALVLSIFPDIDPDHLDVLCEERQWSSSGVLEHILNQQEDGIQYPTALKANLKRKRGDEYDVQRQENTAKRWDNEWRRNERREQSYFKTSNAILTQAFPQLYMDDMRKYMDQHGKLLFPTFLGLSRAVAEWDDQNPPFQKKKTRVCRHARCPSDEEIKLRIQAAMSGGEREALEEFRAARALQAREAAEAETKRRKEQEEIDNFETAKGEGNIADCGCCYVEHALNRMVHCDGEELHWFCRDCARMMAETQIGLGKHTLACMSTDGCSGQFPSHQREIFLDAHSLTALDRIEQEASLRDAGIENLETCPFCPFAMEYPPLEEDKEFRCLMPECKVVSCRACRQETHIPKTCEEAALERGHSARHAIEEAMSAALIRTCNKCATPFIKENGCNKMTCTKCRNIQCYTCSKSCDYTHFNDTARGGRVGQCPLFDKEGTDVRHAEEVKIAEQEARMKVLEDNTDVDAAFLEIKTSERVQKDEQQRLTNDAYRHHPVVDAGQRAGIRQRMQQAMHERRRAFRAQRLAARDAHVAAAQPFPAPFHEAPPAPLQPLPPPAGAAFPPRQNPAAPPVPLPGRQAPLPKLDDVVPAAARPGWAAWNGMVPRLDEAIANVAPGVRQSMPFYAPPPGRGPHGVANEYPHRAERVGPQDEPLNNPPAWLGANAFAPPPLPMEAGYILANHPSLVPFFDHNAPMNFPGMPAAANPPRERQAQSPAQPVPQLNPPYNPEAVADPAQRAYYGQISMLQGALPMIDLTGEDAGNGAANDAAGRGLQGGNMQNLDFNALVSLGDDAELTLREFLENGGLL